jgi:signal transduction histidine kinase
MLTTAQLLTDRLDNVSDDSVQRIAPRLVNTLDRAISFCETTLAYGRATEPLPQRRLTPLASMIEELSNLTDLAPEVGIAFHADVPDDLTVDADPDQLSRVLVNLVRNAVQALSQTGSPNGQPCIDISAHREGGTVIILIKDNGPGIPERAKANLFTPFQGSAQKGGTGLGLPIAAEIVQLHGGTIVLDEGQGRTCFKITIPDRLSAAEAN